MKRGILNSKLLTELSLLGQADQIIVSSAAFPKIDGVKILDLSLVEGVPTIEQVVDAVKHEIDVDMITVSQEVTEFNSDFSDYLKESFSDAIVDYQSYRQLKVIARNASAAIRTGDTHLYKTVVLRADWGFK